MIKFLLGKLKYLKLFLPFWLYLILFNFGAGLHFTLMAPFGEKVLPIWVVGLVVGAASFIQLVLDVPAGFILDKYGYKKMLKITTFSFIVAILFLLWGLNIYTYLLTIFVACFGWLFFGPGVNAYVLSHSPKKEPGGFIPFRDIFNSIGFVLSSAFFVLFLSIPVQTTAIVILLILAAAYVLICFSPDDILKIHEKERIPTQGYYIRRNYINKIIKAIVKLNPASTMLLLTSLSSSIFYAMIWFVVPLVAAKDGAGVMVWGLGVFDFTIVIMGFLLGKLADKANKKMLVFFGLLVFSVMALLLGFNFGFMFLILGFVATTGDEMSAISLWLWMNTLDKNHDEDGLVSGVVNLSQDLGWTIGPIIAGILYSVIGPGLTIAVGGMFIFVVWIIYVLFIGKQQSFFSLDRLAVPKKPHRSRNKR